MEKFTASNNLEVVRKGSHCADMVTWEVNQVTLGTHEMAALREFFLHERDQELGRWRWPKDPNYAAIRADGEAPGRYVVIMDERSGLTYGVPEGHEASTPQGRAAKAYFDAHPAPKPWHDAKPGEVWVIELEDGTECAATREYGLDFKLSYGTLMPPRDERIVAGRCIWPEVVS